MNNKTRTYDTVFALILFFGFALSMLMTLLIGAGVYQRIRNVGDDRREICIRYITTKVRGYDNSTHPIEVGRIDGNSALLFTETFSGVDYVSAIYYYDGYVRELFAESGNTFGAADGEKIVEASGLEFSLDGALLRIRSEGADAFIHLRTGGEPQ
ncbi:MAG: DUF4860 domain-containing protein [Oscillospiraceae bacterium]|nr:DUF4860 domain-containing protein [Oscillospiraceae bacterium]